MGDAINRKTAAVTRLRQLLKKKREALADQFDFKIYMIFHFKNQTKSSAVFEIAEVLPVMTNNYEDSILKGAKDDSYSYESSKELLDKDVVQLHAPRWQCMRKDVIGCTTAMDFLLWPRQDIDHMSCLLFSRWKGDTGAAFKQLQAVYEFRRDDYEKELARLMTANDKSGLIVNNPQQSMFLFVNRRTLKTCNGAVVVFKLSSLCLYLPQDQLMLWGSGTCDEVLQRHLAG